MYNCILSRSPMYYCADAEFQNVGLQAAPARQIRYPVANGNPCDQLFGAVCLRVYEHINNALRTTFSDPASVMRLTGLLALCDSPK